MPSRGRRTSGSGGGGHYGSQECEAARQKQTDDYQANEIAYFQAVHDFGANSPQAQDAIDKWNTDYMNDKAATHAACD